MPYPASEPDDLVHAFDGGTVRQSRFSFSAMDGTRLSALRCMVEITGSGRKAKDRRSSVPLILLPSARHDSNQMLPLVLRMQALQDAPRTCYILDQRGRGFSEKADPDTYIPPVEADDLIALTDMLGIHHADVLANGDAGATAYLATPKRPTLIRRLILNDAAPEFDPVGIARRVPLLRSLPQPRDWADAANILEIAYRAQFPKFASREWELLAQMSYADTDGRPERVHDPMLDERYVHLDIDQRQPTFWEELAMLRNRPVLLLRGEHSMLVTADIAKRVADSHPDLAEIVVHDHGDMPVLALGDLPQRIVHFLQKPDPQPAPLDDEQDL